MLGGRGANGFTSRLTLPEKCLMVWLLDLELVTARRGRALMATIATTPLDRLATLADKNSWPIATAAEALPKQFPAAHPNIVLTSIASASIRVVCVDYSTDVHYMPEAELATRLNSDGDEPQRHEGHEERKQGRAELSILPFPCLRVLRVCYVAGGQVFVCGSGGWELMSCNLLFDRPPKSGDHFIKTLEAD